MPARAALFLAVATAVASATAAPAERLPVTIAGFATTLDPEQVGRTRNIALAAARLDGQCLEMDAVFSLDDALGPRRPGDGYVDAPAILDGERELAPAGGVCQLATTVYNAALLAGLTIVERHPHGRPVPYVPPGRDATVARFHKDLKLRNELGQPLQIKAAVVGERVVVTLLGERPASVAFSIDSRILPGAPARVATYRIAEAPGLAARRELVSEDARP